MVTTTAAAKYHCGTNKVTKEAREAAPPPPQISSVA